MNKATNPVIPEILSGTVLGNYHVIDRHYATYSSVCYFESFGIYNTAADPLQFNGGSTSQFSNWDNTNYSVLPVVSIIPGCIDVSNAIESSGQESNPWMLK